MDDDDIFRRSWPRFLDLLNTNCRGAMARFYTQLSRYVAVMPPGVVRGLSYDDKQDVLQDLYLFFYANDGAKLRKYEDHGKPFVAWLHVVASRFASAWIKKQSKKTTIDGNETGVEPNSDIHPRTKGIVRECLEWIAKKKPVYAQLLELWAEGYKPRDMIDLAGYKPGDNKKVFGHLSQAKEWFRRCLRKKRLGRSDVF